MTNTINKGIEFHFECKDKAIVSQGMISRDIDGSYTTTDFMSGELYYGKSLDDAVGAMARQVRETFRKLPKC